MLERPALRDDAIVACVRNSYGLDAAGIGFLPIGNDSGAWAYRVDGQDGRTYFLKLRRGTPYEPGLAVPRYLADAARPADGETVQVVAPLWTDERALWVQLDGFAVMLYPFVDGPTGREAGLSDGQREALGAAAARIHGTRLPPALSYLVRREDFVPPWAEMTRMLQRRIDRGGYEDASQAEVAAFWQARREEIGWLVGRTEALGRLLQQRAGEFVLCHSDLHTANVLVDSGGRLFIVDWDAPVLAPRERDLMFVVGDASGPTAPRSSAEASFFRGYGPVEVDPLALAYYRYEWAVQEIGDYGERILFMDDVGPETRQHAVRGFMGLFGPGDEVESAYESEAMLPAALRAVGR